MGKILVLAEKPSVGRELAKVLNCNQSANGYISGSKYIVTWALGHLVTLADPEEYDVKYKQWKIEDLPMLPNELKLVVIKETRKQFEIVRELMKKSEVDELVIATDAGREGELVARWVINKANFRKPIKRLWISSQTEKAIMDGFKNLKNGSDCENLYNAAEARAEADWIVGLNVTRALTTKYNAQLSAGRVQTPTLAMIVEREAEINKFKPVDYWTINGNFRGFTLQWIDKNGERRLFNKERAVGIVASLEGVEGIVSEVNNALKKELPPLAYDLTELQRDANKIFGYSAKQTLNLMQRLYENHKLLSYPRTDSRYITTDIVSTLQDRLKAIAVGPYSSFARNIIKTGIVTNNRFVDNNKVSDHHAIIPTEQYVDLSSLNKDERNIYDLVVRRFLQVLSPASEFEQISIKVTIKHEIFAAKGKIIKTLGWKEISQNTPLNSNDKDEQSLQQINSGEKVMLSSLKYLNEKTTPPPRYTEATLLTAMEHPGKNIDDESLKEALEKSSGLGTPATRADIIEKLFNTFYIERKGKEIHPTSKGIQLIELVPEGLRSPMLTATWESQLQKIGLGTESSKTFINNMRKYAKELVSNVINASEVYRHDNATRVKCPQCGKYMLEVNGKRGKIHVCQDRDCGYRKNVSQQSNARCPECHKKMELRGEGESKIFVCSCGYKEKLTAFTKRKETSGKGISKKDVSKYLKNQNNDTGNFNSAMADALAKLKDFNN